MNIGHVLFSPNGRIGQQDYWIGLLIIIGGNIVASVLPVIGFILWLVLVWMGVAVYGKRLHDAGKSAWLHVIPWAITIVTFIIGVVMIAMAGVTAGLMSDGGDLSPEQIGALLSGGAGGLAVMSLSTLVWIGYTIWVGVMKGEPQANAHGPVPGGQVNPAPAASTGQGPSEG
jgi:uncharacterized membrane protein YhaH (DUF805 family)